MSLALDRLEAFRRAFVREAALRLGARRDRRCWWTQWSSSHELDLHAAEELGRLAPFGAANAQPIFALPGVTTESTRLVGQGHLQLTLRHRGATGDAIAFGMADRDPGRGAWSIWSPAPSWTPFVATAAPASR